MADLLAGRRGAAGVVATTEVDEILGVGAGVRLYGPRAQVVALPPYDEPVVRALVAALARIFAADGVMKLLLELHAHDHGALDVLTSSYAPDVEPAGTTVNVTLPIGAAIARATPSSSSPR